LFFPRRGWADRPAPHCCTIHAFHPNRRPRCNLPHTPSKKSGTVYSRSRRKTLSMSMPLDNDSHRNATVRFRNSDDLEPVRQAAWSVHAIDEAAEEVRAIVAKHLTPTDSTKALQALNHVYAGAPRNVQDAIVHNPDALLILECAAGEANAPLTKKVAGPVLPRERGARRHALPPTSDEAPRREIGGRGGGPGHAGS
jgi:hypothetical protein